jgi:hypothetical protein
MSARSKKPPEEPPETLEDQDPTDPDPPRPGEVVEAQSSGSFRVISMKTPAVGQPDPVKSRPMPKVKLRAMAPQPKPKNLGSFAPPRDAAEVRARQMRDYVILGCVSVIFACAIALVVWFLAR